ncbi:AAA family ATPase [Seohaeicola nanhaiensis]|uniref:AAA family ATPase n=1 Tax=Seohaeicola nanhaiensis TaxID=1387282 RepID=A0ABV9KAQ6_9RHOB
MKRYLDTPNNKAAQDANLEAALALAKAGVPVIPAEIVERPGKAPVKKPCIEGWQSKATTDPAQVRRWWKQFAHALPGIVTGPRSGIAVLDLDRKDGKDGFATLRAMGHDPDGFAGPSLDTPTGGRHIYFRHSPGLRSTTGKIGDGVDVRAEGGFVVAPGAVNGSGVYGQLSGSLGDLPEWPKRLKPPPRERKKSTGEKTGLPFAEVVDALMAIPNDGTNPDDDGRDWWLHIGMALHHETDGDEEGREAFHNWCDQHRKYDFDKTEAAWDSFGGEGRTAATILREAYKHGWHNAAAHERRLAEDLELLDECWTPEELVAGSARAALEELDRIVFGDDQTESRLTFLSPSDCEDLPSRAYIIKGLLAEGDVGTIVGAPGAGKSLLAPYLAFKVAQGKPAFGRRTRQGGVFYVAAEDALGMRARVRALREEHGEADGFKLVTGVSDLLTKGSPDLKELVKAIKRHQPALIVIDTVAIAFPGLEENDAKSMGRVVAVARHLTRWGAAVLLIHHDTKDGANGLPRGHSILNGALDVNLFLKREDGAVTGKLTKNRNGSTDEKLAFTVATIPLGEDEDGDTITTALCREADSADAGSREVKLSPSANAALTVFCEIGDGAPVGESIWRDRAIEGRRVSAADDRDGRRRTFKRAVEELTRKNVLVFREGKFTMGDSPEALLGDDDV